MDRKTRKSLKESIAHWYRISACKTKEELYNKAAGSLRQWLETGEWYNTDQDNIEAEIRFLEGLL